MDDHIWDLLIGIVCLVLARVLDEVIAALKKKTSDKPDKQDKRSE